MSEPVTETTCEKHRNVMHSRINQRASWFIMIPVLLVIAGGMATAYRYTHSVEVAQKELITKQDLKYMEDRIMSAIKTIRK